MTSTVQSTSASTPPPASATTARGAGRARRDHTAQIKREVRVFQSPITRYGSILLVALAVIIPLSTADTFLLSLGATVGFYAIASIGLNVLNGYAGQINLGQPFFLAIGAFTAVFFGSDLNLPLPVWVIASAITAGLVGMLVAPFALRMKGVYQIVLSLGLIFIGHYIFVNWEGLTGGVSGRRAPLNMSVGPVDFGDLVIGGMAYNYQQGLFMIIWLVVALCMFIVHLLMKSPGGRGIVALRDSELAGRVAGLNPTRSMLGTYALSSALGGVGGAFYVAQLRFVSIEQFNLQMGLTFIIIVTVGGLATAWGPVLGSLVIASLPVLAGRYAEYIPFLKESSSVPTGEFGIPVGQFSVVAYGVILILILIFEPKGLVHLLQVGWGLVTKPFRRRAKAAGDDDGGGDGAGPPTDTPNESAASATNTNAPGTAESTEGRS